jgi:hypothetical protein
MVGKSVEEKDRILKPYPRESVKRRVTLLEKTVDFITAIFPKEAGH